MIQAQPATENGALVAGGENSAYMLLYARADCTHILLAAHNTPVAASELMGWPALLQR
jgi:hypothetical protein